MSFQLILFDLDGTVYTRESGLLKEIGHRIRLWLRERLELSPDEAARVQRDYFVRYGTTLNGLIAERQVDVDDYLWFVHDIPVAKYLPPNPALTAMLTALPLRRAIYTNATTEYSWRVLGALGASECFERIISIEDVGLRNKMHRESYERALALLDAQGPECIMVEDTAGNLSAAKATGLTTVLVGQDGSGEPTEISGESIDFRVDGVLDVGSVVQSLCDSMK